MKKQEIKDLKARISHHGKMIEAILKYLDVDVGYHPCECGKSSLPNLVKKGKKT